MLLIAEVPRKYVCDSGNRWGLAIAAAMPWCTQVEAAAWHAKPGFIYYQTQPTDSSQAATVTEGEGGEQGGALQRTCSGCQAMAL